MEKEPGNEGPTRREPPNSIESPPPFQPDYELITLLEGGSERKLRRFRQELEKQESARTAQSDR